ncbi:MAG: hypothetical protein RR405_00175 [Clostridia bacterium]
MSYTNKDYGLIDLNALAGYFNSVLGSTFIVKANCLATPIDGPQTVCTLHATRVPFAIADVRSETMNVTFYFRVRWFPEKEREQTILEMKRLLGYQRFGITEKMCIVDDTTHEECATPTDKSYNCTSFLEMQPPMGTPQVDSGGKYLDMQITGTILVTDSDGGAVMSNDIVTFAKLNDTDNPVPLPIVYISSNDGFNIEMRVPTGKISPIPAPTYSENKQTIQALYLAREFDKNLVTGIKNKQQMHIYLDEVFDTNMTVSRKYTVLSLSLTRSAGAYTQYTMDLQECSEI